jgi:hypothetical protein
MQLQVSCQQQLLGLHMAGHASLNAISVL